jgi:hypothetical protein
VDAVVRESGTARGGATANVAESHVRTFKEYIDIVMFFIDDKRCVKLALMPKER